MKTGTRTQKKLPARVSMEVWRSGAGYHTQLQVMVRRASASGRAHCKACGARLLTGEPVYALWYDFTGRGGVCPEVLTKCYLHEAACVDAGLPRT